MSNFKIITGSTGAGKTDFIDKYCANNDRILLPDTETTREPKDRDKEHFKKYIHVSEQDFIKKVDTKNYFFEYNLVNGKYYGTPNYFLNKAFSCKKDLFLEIDPESAIKIINRKYIDYDFKPKIFFLWRDIYPLDNFSTDKLSKLIEEILIKREPNISEEELNKRKQTTFKEYLLVRNNADKFILLQNDGVTDNHIKKFETLYPPTFYPV